MKSTPTLTRALTALLAVVPTFFALPARAVPGPTALPFVAVTPCRLVDTRGLAAALPGGGSVPPATTRNYTIAGACGIPADAKAVSLNATVTNTGGPGFLVLWPKGAAVPPVSTLNFLAGETIANAAVVPLSADGSLSVALGVSGADVILDVNGYYSPLGVVNSVNGLGGNVTLVPGANVTITPGAGTLAISAASGTGPQGPTGPQGVPGPPGGAGPTGPAGTFDAACVLATTTWTQMRDCQLAPATVYNGIPSPTPPNVPSQAFQAQQTAEFGDAITLAGTARKGVSATVLMSNWAKHSDYPGMSAAGA
jgi:hypothetical protein